VRLTTSPPSRAVCHELWEPKSPGTLWATPGLLRDCFTFIMSTLYIHEQGCEDPCLLFEAERGPPARNFGNLVLMFNHLFNDALNISGCIATNGRVNSE